MQFSRLSILFAFFAFSFARADCTDFEIFANQVSLGCGNVVSTDIIYGDSLILSISPADGNIKWKATTDIVISTEPEYTPILIENITKTITYFVERNGVSKRINVNFYPSYIVSFDTDEGEPSVSSQRVRGNYTAQKPTETLTKIGYNFDSWNFNFNTPITKDTTIKAKWIAETYSIAYNPNGGTMIPASPPTSYNINSPDITMPTLNERCGYRFDGWFDNPNFSGTPITTIPTGSIGNKTFYANWTNAQNTPTINMLSYSLTSANNKIYNGSPIAPIAVSSASACPMGVITTLYNDSRIEPINAGIYQIYAYIEANENYIAEKILLGSITINKANATFNISATVNDKEYDGTTTATVKSTDVTLTGTLYGTDEFTASDYSVTANFDDPNVGTHNINLTVTWLNGLLAQNYNLVGTTTPPISATITKATNFILEIEAKDYELSDPGPHKITINKSSYISDVLIEYKREGDANYVSMQKPNRVGNWSVRATVEENTNYEGKSAATNFVVTRGGATTVVRDIEFTDSGFDIDPALSGKQRSYYVANTSLCKIKDTKIQIRVKESDIILRIGNIPQRGEFDENDYAQYEIPFAFGKPGLDTLIYELISIDNKYREYDTILIETPVPFETVIMQKWNNVLFVNNNPQTNGDYEFTNYKWFKNNDSIGNLQFYSAGPNSVNTLNPNDVYKVVMQTTEGIRISTCEGKVKISSGQPIRTKKRKTKQVLGINEKPLNPSSKIYNLNGKLTKETPAGVYIVEE
ncbi:MAG: InlB B-repeat-containing protein [Fibromonadales bacterium]|nr:InlB B-repeat-containing protein [Fibromonadales bacterium]